MTVPTYTTTEYTGSASDSNSWAVFTGVSVDRGSILLVVAGDNVTLSTASSGWQKLGQGTGSGSAFAVFRKTVSGSGDFTLASSGVSQFSALLVKVSGGGSVSGTVAGSSNPPNHNIGTTRDALWVAALGIDGAIGLVSQPAAAPTGFSDLTDVASSGSGGSWLYAAFKSASGDSSENPGAFTPSGVGELSWTIALYAGGGRRSGGFL